MELTSRGVCYERFSMENPPRVLPCGHTLCSKCISKILLKNKIRIECPTDRKIFLVHSLDVEQFPKNYQIMADNPDTLPKTKPPVQDGFVQVIIKDQNDISFCIQLPKGSLVKDIKANIEENKGIDLGDTMLMYRGKRLDEKKTLEQEKIDNGSTILLNAKFTGGCLCGFYLVT